MTTSGGSSAVVQDRASPLWTALLILLVLLPLPFGGNRPWAWSAMALWTAILLGGWSASLVLGRRVLVWRKALILPLLAVLLLIGWIIVTMLPLPGLAHPVWQMASEALGRPLTGRITLSVDATLVATMRLLAYATIFWLSLQFSRAPRRAEQLLLWISWSGLAYALYGLVNHFAGNSHILWFERLSGGGAVSSTFINRNHYATFAALGMMCATGIGVTAFRAAWQQSDRSQKVLSRTIECLIGRPLLYFVIMLVIGMAWLQTQSRMGAIAGVVGLITMFVLMMAARLVRRTVAPWVVGALALLFLFQVSGAATLDRLGSTHDIDRLPILSVVADQIADAPLTGSGYGTFAQAFLTYRDQRIPFSAAVTEAHNSYIELAAELGVPAALLLIVTIIWCAILCLVAVFLRQRGQIYPILAFAGTVTVATHALLDFSLQIPAVAALYAALLGAGVAQSWTTKAGR